MNQPIDFKKQLDSIRAAYAAEGSSSNFSMLLIGDPGAGKTSLLRTARRPILLDSFDPQGELSVLKRINGQASVEDGSILVRRFADENSKKPSEYARWDPLFQKDIETGFLNNFGTYCIDSGTTFIQAAVNELIKVRRAKNPKLDPDALDQAGYRPLYNMVRDVIKMASSQKCDFIFTIHLLPAERDEISGSFQDRELAVFRTLKSELPLLFSERYVMQRSTVGGKESFKLLTAPKGLIKLASTRIGGHGLLAAEEEADIKAILKKVKFPTEDKPF